MNNELIDLMECPLDTLREVVKTLLRDVAIATLKMRQRREDEKIRRCFTGNLHDNWIPSNCKRGLMLTPEQIGTLRDMCVETLVASVEARKQIAELYDAVRPAEPTRMEVAAKAD
jgi:hypothetical protein